MNPRRLYKYSLADCVEKRLGIVLDKSADTWRTRYSELRDVPLNDWPADAVSYALDDASVTHALRVAQDADETAAPARRGHYVYLDAPAQARAGWALALCRAWGIRTDPVQTERTIASLKETQARVENDLIAAGFIAPGRIRPRAKDYVPPKRNMKVIASYVERVCAANGVEVELTENDGVALDKVTLKRIGDPTLDKLMSWTGAQKSIGYTAILRAGFEHAIHSEPNTLVENGRISWGSESPEGAKEARSVNLTNLPTAPGVRECYVPRAGRVFVSVDYSQLELRTFAQSCLWLVGESTMARLINDGMDLHCYLAAQFVTLQGTPMSYDTLKARYNDDPMLGKVRDAAKRANFGFLGGMGIDRFQDTNYDLGLSRDDVVALKSAFLSAYPETTEYFARAAEVDSGERQVVAFTSGRVRGDMGYCDTANGWFSSLAADGAKDALYRVSRLMYADTSSVLFGGRLNAFIHDELFGELHEHVAHEGALEIERVMRETMQERLPDVKVSCTAALMRAWSKRAKPKHDATGRLIPFEDA